MRNTTLEYLLAYFDANGYIYFGSRHCTYSQIKWHYVHKPVGTIFQINDIL